MVHYVMKLIAIGDALAARVILEAQIGSILQDVAEEVIDILTISVYNGWLIESQA